MQAQFGYSTAPAGYPPAAAAYPNTSGGTYTQYNPQIVYSGGQYDPVATQQAALSANINRIRPQLLDGSRTRWALNSHSTILYTSELERRGMTRQAFNEMITYITAEYDTGWSDLGALPGCLAALFSCGLSSCFCGLDDDTHRKKHEKNIVAYLENLNTTYNPLITFGWERIIMVGTHVIIETHCS